MVARVKEGLLIPIRCSRGLTSRKVVGRVLVDDARSGAVIAEVAPESSVVR